MENHVTQQIRYLSQCLCATLSQCCPYAIIVDSENVFACSAYGVLFHNSTALVLRSSSHDNTTMVMRNQYAKSLRWHCECQQNLIDSIAMHRNHYNSKATHLPQWLFLNIPKHFWHLATTLQNHATPLLQMQKHWECWATFSQSRCDMRRIFFYFSKIIWLKLCIFKPTASAIRWPNLTSQN